MGKKLEGNGVFESSRMMLPEHVKQYVRYSEQSRQGGPQKRPVLDDSELEDMSRKLTESKQYGREVTLTVWGRNDPVRGVVSRIDSYSKRVTVQQFWGDAEVVKLEDIIGVE